MSNLPGNHYMQQLVECTMPKTPESLATLALAYEQRTANLIALAQLTMHEPAHEDYDMAAIYERLGLETGAEE